MQKYAMKTLWLILKTKEYFTLEQANLEAIGNNDTVSSLVVPIFLHTNVKITILYSWTALMCGIVYPTLQ